MICMIASVKSITAPMLALYQTGRYIGQRDCSYSSWLSGLSSSSHQHTTSYVRRSCKGHGISCWWLPLLLKPNTGGDKWYEIYWHSRCNFKYQAQSSKISIYSRHHYKRSLFSSWPAPLLVLLKWAVLKLAKESNVGNNSDWDVGIWCRYIL